MFWHKLSHLYMEYPGTINRQSRHYAEIVQTVSYVFSKADSVDSPF